MSPQSRLSLERKVDELQADLTQAHDRLRELSALLSDAGIPGGTTLYGGVLILRERAEKAEAALAQVQGKPTTPLCAHGHDDCGCQLKPTTPETEEP